MRAAEAMATRMASVVKAMRYVVVALAGILLLAVMAFAFLMALRDVHQSVGAETYKIVLTSCLTIAGGILVLVLGQIAAKFFIEPLDELRQLRGEIANGLIFYACWYANPGTGKDPDMKQASDALRQLASHLVAKAHAVPWYGLWAALGVIPEQAGIRGAHRGLMGLSNSIFTPDSNYNDEWRRQNEERRREIERSLDIRTGADTPNEGGSGPWDERGQRMKRTTWLGLVSLCFVLIFAALVLGGGVYRTVNAGRGTFYVVNRFTGRTFRVQWGQKTEVRMPPGPRRRRDIHLKDDDLAIAMAKNRWHDLGSEERNHDWIIRQIRERDGQAWLATAPNQECRALRIVAWKAADRSHVVGPVRRNAGVYLVSFTLVLAPGCPSPPAKPEPEPQPRATVGGRTFGEIESEYDAAVAWAQEKAYSLRRSKGNETGWWWEVDVITRHVWLVNGDAQLEARYGLQRTTASK